MQDLAIQKNWIFFFFFVVFPRIWPLLVNCYWSTTIVDSKQSTVVGCYFAIDYHVNLKVAVN